MEKLTAGDRKYIWHPYTQMKDCKTMPPIPIKRAKGIRLYDHEGRFYYDTISSWWCNVHGHNHPAIKKAIKRQLDSLEHVLFAGFTHAPAVNLARRLVEITPRSLTKVFFSDNGSTAVETALKMSYQYWHNTGRKGKRAFISLDHGYHGDTIGAMSVSGVDLFNGIFKSLFFRSFKAPAPYCYRCPAGKSAGRCDIECIGSLENVLKKKKNMVAAMVLEPLLLAAGGMIVYPKEYLARAAALARKYNVHLIIDEVATGFGRTGKMFACDHVNIEPDFMCLSKGITSGYMPLGVTMTSNAVYGAFYDDHVKAKTFYHGHTYAANPLACSCALASLDVFRDEDVLGRVGALIPAFHAGMERFRRLPIVGDVRYLGMVGAIELVRDRRTKERFGFKERVGARIYKEGLARSLILRPLGNIIYLFLPLCVKKGELEYILDAAHDIVTSAGKKILQNSRH